MKNSLRSAIVTAIVFASSPVLAQSAGVFSYQSHANYCPVGLQPVSINGVVCCGTPDQGQTYQQALRHPVRQTVGAATAYQSCPAGAKGCD